MRKFLSIALAALMALSAVILSAGAEFDGDGNWIPANGEWESISREGVVVRFAIGADTHYCAYNSLGKNTFVYNALKQIGGVDALLVAGDLTNAAGDGEYENMMKTVNAYTSENVYNPNGAGDSVGATILSMGNHDFMGDGDEEKFTRYTGLEANALYWINGIPVIALSPNAYTPERSDESKGNNYDERFEFLESAYREIDAGYDGLIIVMAHHRPDTEGDENKYYSQKIMDLMKAHPNTVIFTGHSHTWIHPTKEFVFQDAGFTHVRAGSLCKNYGGLGSADINPNTGENEFPLRVDEDSNCSLVLVDVMEDGTAKLRRLDIAKGEIMFPDEDFVIRPGVLTDFLTDTAEGSYGCGAQTPSFPDGADVLFEKQGDDSSVTVHFPEAVPATNLAKDFVSEYRIRFADTNGKYFTYEGKEYIRVANYRAKADDGKAWTVLIRGLDSNTDYTVEVQAVTTYNMASAWISSAASQ